MNWSFLESTYSFSAVPAVWRQGLGTAYEVFRARFLERQAREPMALSYPCPRVCGCAHEVIQHGPEDIVAVCRCEPWRCDDIALSAEELVCWTVSWSRLGRALCECLALDIRSADLGLVNTRQIGAWSGGAVPAILTLQPEARRFHWVLLELGARLQRPFILLAPSAAHLDAAGVELLARAKAVFVDLASHVRITPAGALVPTRPPGELFKRLAPEPNREDQSVFQRAFALVKALDERGLRSGPSAVAVFSDYCLQGLAVSDIAWKHRCSRTTIMARLQRLEAVTGLKRDALRAVSSHVGALEDQLADSRAARINRRHFIEEEGNDE